MLISSFYFFEKPVKDGQEFIESCIILKQS